MQLPRTLLITGLMLTFCLGLGWCAGLHSPLQPESLAIEVEGDAVVFEEMGADAGDAWGDVHFGLGIFAAAKLDLRQGDGADIGVV